jgi:predicted nucleotidyltransferase
MYGLRDSDLKYLKNAFRRYSSIEKVILFGSRALGNYKNGSDIDLAIKGEKGDEIRSLSAHLNEDSPLPYHFDVLDYNTITHQNLLDHIQRVGITIYSRNNRY